VFCVPPSDIDLDDNFFSLGGDSVLAIKLVAAARTGGLDLSLEAIFDHPVLSDMASITKGLTRGEETPIDIAPFSLLDRSWDINLVLQEARKRCSIAPHNIRDIYPVTPMQEGLLALSMKDDGTYILQFVYQMPETIDLDKLKSEPLNWDVVDGDLASFLTAEKQRGFLLENTMSRLSAVRQDDPRQYFLVWTIHHALVSPLVLF
jgi:aryl carrier-like protein